MNNSIYKKISIYAVSAIILISNTIGGTNVYASDIPRTNAAITQENILAIADAYDPDGAYILRKTAERGNDFTIWWKGQTYQNITDHINAAVHESYHQISWIYNVNDAENYYLGEGKDDVKVDFTENFTSDLIYPSIPDTLKKISHSDRAGKYIAGNDMDSNTGSVQNGIYGILNEYAAYVRNAHTDVALIDYVESHDADWWNFENYIGNLANDVEAQAQFTFYILHYLAYAKANNIGVYNGIMENENFRTVLKEISDMSYDNVSAVNTDILPRLVKYYDAAGYRSYYNDTYFGVMFPTLFEEDNGNKISQAGIGLYYDSYYAHMEALQAEPYKSIAKELDMNISYSHITQMTDVSTLYIHDENGILITREEWQRRIDKKNEELNNQNSGNNSSTSPNSGDSFKLASSDIISINNVGNGINIIWEKSDNAQRYEIHRFDANGKNDKVIATISDNTQTTYIDTSAIAGDAYCYQIYSYATPPFGYAEEICSTGAQSNIIARLTTPKLSSVKKSGKKKLVIKYKKVKGASGYKIEYSTNKGFTKKKTLTVSKASTLKKTISKLKSKKKYYVRVRAYKKIGTVNVSYSAWSNTKNAKTK